LITSIAQRAGFGGGLVVDYPNSKKARKVFLCLFVGDGGSAQVPKGLQGDDPAAAEGEDAKVNAKFESRRQRESRRERNGKQKAIKGGKDWILRKKDVRCAPSYPSVALFPPPLIDRF
jgi:18S rRNA (guanine1575-N7)-methyltransferase